MTTKTEGSKTTDSISTAVDWLAEKTKVKSLVNKKSSLKDKLRVIVNSERVKDYSLPSGGSVIKILQDIAKHISLGGSKFADEIVAAAKAHPSESAGGTSYCLRWVVNALNRAGLSGSKINAPSAKESWYRYPSKQHTDKQIPTGAIVYGRMYSDRPVSDLADWGHVGICVKGIDQVSNINDIEIRSDFYYNGTHGPVTEKFSSWQNTYPYRGYYLYEEL